MEGWDCYGAFERGRGVNGIRISRYALGVGNGYLGVLSSQLRKLNGQVNTEARA